MITLVNSYLSLHDESPYIYQNRTYNVPLGLLSISANLRAHGFETRLVDLDFLLKQKKIRLNDDFNRRCAKVIASEEADIICFNTRCDTYPTTVNIAKHCREYAPDTPIVLGGPGATFVDNETLAAFDFIDVIVRGQGEDAMVEVAKRLRDCQTLKDVKGVTFRENGRIIRNADRGEEVDWNRLPLPDYGLVDDIIKENTGSNRETNFYITLGGECPYSCSFCTCWMLWKGVSRRPAEKVMEEIRFLKDRYDASNFIFVTDNFTVDKGYVMGLCDLLRKNRVRVSWSVATRIDNLDVKTTRLMAKSGCKGIFFGIETGSKRMQESINKGVDLTKVHKVLGECEKNGINSVAAFIIGFPDETIEDVNATLKLAIECASHPNTGPIIFNLIMEPKTKIFERYKERLARVRLLPSAAMRRISDIGENSSLIASHPLIFSPYYSVQNQGVSEELLWRIGMEYYSLVQFYPRTLYAASLELGIGFYELFRELDAYGGRPGSVGKRLRRYLLGKYDAKSADDTNIRVFMDYEGRIDEFLRRAKNTMMTGYKATGKDNATGITMLKLGYNPLKFGILKNNRFKKSNSEGVDLFLGRRGENTQLSGTCIMTAVPSGKLSCRQRPSR
jgi:radical SAM superfamily enzyme YgiQ (UPF0313 family)